MPCRRATASTARPTTGRKPRWWCVSRWSMAMPASRTRATWASSSRSISAGIDPPLRIQAAMKSCPRATGSRRPAPAASGTLAGVGDRPPAAQRQVDADAQRRAPRPASPAPRSRSGAVAQQRGAGDDPVAVGPQDPARNCGRHAEIVGVDDQTNARIVTAAPDPGVATGHRSLPRRKSDLLPSCVARPQLTPFVDDDIPDESWRSVS